MVASIELRDAAGRLRLVPERSMIAAAKAVKAAADDEARAATGDGRMSGVGRRGARIRAVDRIRVLSGGAVICRIQGVPVGAWVWVNTGADPHTIAPRTRGRRRARPVMAGGLGHPVSGTVRHPGMRGRGAWRKVVGRAERIVPAIFAEGVSEAVR